MKRFLTKITLVFTLLVGIISIIYLSLDFLKNSKKSNGSIFLWGDSQLYQGVNTKLLRKLTGKEIHSSARHGSGIYDFLVFAESVPDNSVVVVGFSKPMQMRRKEEDGCSLGFSFNALFNLYKNNYSWGEVIEIVDKNRKVENKFVRDHMLYPINDSIVINEPLSLLIGYAERPYFLDDRQTLYLSGLKRLFEKECQIVIAEFPFHKILLDIENKSVVRNDLEKFRREVLGFCNVQKPDTLQLYEERNLMYDLTHLNEFGANFYTKYLAKMIKEQQFSRFLTMKNKAGVD